METGTKEQATKADFLSGMLHGVLVLKPFQVRIGEEMKTFQAGDVIKVTKSKIANPDNNEFVTCIASRCAGRKDGEKKPGTSVAVFSTKAQLNEATKAYRERIITGLDAEAWERIETGLTVMKSQGRAIKTPRAWTDF